MTSLKAARAHCLEHTERERRHQSSAAHGGSPRNPPFILTNRLTGNSTPKPPGWPGQPGPAPTHPEALGEACTGGHGHPQEMVFTPGCTRKSLRELLYIGRPGPAPRFSLHYLGRAGIRSFPSSWVRLECCQGLSAMGPGFHDHPGLKRKMLIKCKQIILHTHTHTHTHILFVLDEASLLICISPQLNWAMGCR